VTFEKSPSKVAATEKPLIQRASAPALTHHAPAVAAMIVRV
jgi:hypothetical protein